MAQGVALCSETIDCNHWILRQTTSVSIETTSVSLVVDIEAASHPSVLSVRHTDEPQQGEIRVKQLSVALPSLLG